MRTAPGHWQARSWLALLLYPLSGLYWLVARWRLARQQTHQLPVPVVCVGNTVVGGAGKTPTVLAICERLKAQGLQPHVISRGYGGHYSGTLRVDPSLHEAAEVGDEPLMMAAYVPCWVSHKRVRAAQAAIAAGADVLVMDDGLQNPTIHKDYTVLVVDGAYGFGNGWMLPAGPCREPIGVSLAKADTVLVMGEVKHPRLKRQLPAHIPVHWGRVQPVDAAALDGKKVHAFAGIAHPDKFFATVAAMGAEIALTTYFADHQVYRQDDLARLEREAQQHGAQLVTTEKDFVRLPVAFRDKVQVVKVALDLDDADGFASGVLEAVSGE